MLAGMVETHRSGHSFFHMVVGERTTLPLVVMVVVFCPLLILQ
jgi:hypothetical protein